MKVIETITENLIRKGYIPEEDRDIFLYGFDISFYTIWSTAILFLIDFVLRQFTAALIIVLGFYTFQSAGGGYHANTHLKCLLTMIVGLLLFPLVLHPNKAYLETERKRLTIRSVIVTLSVIMPVIFINVFWDRFLYAFSAVCLLAGVSRIAGKLAYKDSYLNKR